MSFPVVLVLVCPLAAGEPLAAAPALAGLEAAADYSASHRGQATLVMYDGAILFERYDNGGGVGRRQMLASGSKSFVGVLAAAAVQDGLFDLDDPACDAIAEWRSEPLKSRIAYRHLLTLTSGLTPSVRGFRQPGWAAAAALPMTGEPGGQFQYGANQLNVFALALERKLGGESFEEYLDRRLLKPIGVRIEWRVRCADGRPQVGGGAFATARDWAKFGELVRLGGRHGGEELVRSALLAKCFEGTRRNPAYGQTWWLKAPVEPGLRRKITILDSEWADVANADRLPNDLVAALGAGKQRLYVVPSRKLVIVRQGGLAARGFSDVEFLSRILKPSAPAGRPTTPPAN